MNKISLMFSWILLIVFSTSSFSQNSIEFDLEDTYLNFPVSWDEEFETRLELVVEGEAVRTFDIFLPDKNPDFWVFMEISTFKGKKALLKTSSGEDMKGLELVYQSDERTYLENVYTEDYRPQLHFSSMRGWHNDPNGLIYYDGEYHLFYQHNPYGWGWGNMHWGHAVSTDLMHWKQLPEALYPDEVGVAFSGCTVIDYNNTTGFRTGEEEVMVAIFTSTFIPDDEQEMAGMESMERQSLAYSNDRGRTWHKYEGNPVIGDRSKELNSWMILFEKIGLSIFNSDNLKEWTHESYFETFWECPELFELSVDGDKSNTKWVVYDAGGDYVIGDFDGKNFTVENGPYTYINGEFFAAQTYENIPDNDGRQIQIGWATIETPDMPFNMMMAFPTVLSLRMTHDGVRLFNEPIKEIENLHVKEHVHEDLSMDEANERIGKIETDNLHLKFQIDNVNIMNYGLRIGGDNLNYTIRNNTFEFNEENFFSKYLPELGSNKISYEIIVDKTSIEVFVDQGRFTMVLARDLESEEKGLEFWSDNGMDMKIKTLEIYEMKSIWE
jgi:sucrose-6-phosphate hydrolase SacC (GH32 family)